MELFLRNSPALSSKLPIFCHPNRLATLLQNPSGPLVVSSAPVYHPETGTRRGSARGRRRAAWQESARSPVGSAPRWEPCWSDSGPPRTCPACRTEAPEARKRHTDVNDTILKGKFYKHSISSKYELQLGHIGQNFFYSIDRYRSNWNGRRTLFLSNLFTVN